MQVIHDSVATHSVPPQWWVSNGTLTVGPVDTGLLLRGVLHGRVPSSAWVRQTAWQNWREVHKIREVSALKRVIERDIEDYLPAATLRDGVESIEHATDVGEALLFALHAAAQATSATVALAHRAREPLFRATISCIFEAPSERLGEVLPWFDPALMLAQTGVTRVLSGRGDPGSAEYALAERLSPEAPLAGLAVVPVILAGELHAVLELGRSDHPFRTSDTAELAHFAQHLALTLQRLKVQQSRV